MAYINGIDEEKRIINSIGAGLSLDDEGKITADVLQSELDAKQTTIDSSNRLDANLIGSNGNVSNAEYGHLSSVTSNIQDQLDAKEPGITSSNRLDVILCGVGNVDNQDFAKLTLASDLTDTIKNILTQPSTKLIQAGTGLSYNNSTTPPTLNAEVSTSSLNTSLSSKQDTLTLTDITFNQRASSFFPNRTVSTATKAAFNGAIMAKSLINWDQNGSNPAFITFGTRFTSSNNEISLGTNGNTRLFIATDGRTIIGSDDTTPESTNDDNIYAVQIPSLQVSNGAHGLYVSTGRQKNVLRMAYPIAGGTFRYLDIETPNDSTNTIDDFILQSDNRFRCKINSSSVFRCDPSPAGQFTVFNFNNSSDDRIKSNETPITNALESIMKLKPYTYDKYNDMKKTGIPFKESGLISQDLWYDAPELRHLVSLGKYFETDETLEPDENGVKMKKDANLIPTDIDNHEELKDTDFNPSNGWSDQEPSSVKYLGLIAYLIKAVQEQNNLITNLTQRIESLEA